MEVADKLIEFRLRRGLLQREIANQLEILRQSYSDMERGKTGHRSKAMQKAIDSKVYTESERKELHKQYEILKEKELKYGKTAPREKAEMKKHKTMKERKRMAKRRIPNIKNFYRDLYALGDLSEISETDERLLALRKKVGGKQKAEHNFYVHENNIRGGENESPN